MTRCRLAPDEEAMLAGEGTPAEQLAMKLIVGLARMTGAPSLIPISRAHVDGCLYHGPASLDFARTLHEGGGQVRVPTTLNVGIVDLLHPELFRGSAEVAQAGREMMRHYAAMGCRQTWTCAPYQLPERPATGEQVAWAESNAIVFANSVLGARTERYGDFVDLAAAITGRVPLAGLHTDAGRRATVHVRVHGPPPEPDAVDIFCATLGHWLGLQVGRDIAVIDGLAGASEDDLKALGAAAASSGAVAMFHVVGVTPEAPTLEAALGGRPPARVLDFTAEAHARARAELHSAVGESLGAVSVGTPHFSLREFERMVTLLAGRRIHPSIECYVSTGRDVLAAADERGWGQALREAGVRIVTDTCTYLTPILQKTPGVVMTNSAKWAWYAPGNLGYRVAFGSLRECVEAAVAGHRA